MRRLSLIALLTVAVVVASVGAAVAAGFQPVRGNPADKLVDVPIDDYRYDRAKDCRKRPTKGTEAFAAWLDQNAGGVLWGIMRCERWGKNSASLHAEGRAVDWHLDARTPADKREAKRIINLLLAPDRAGNPHALARRMGVQEIIWDCKSWWSGAEGMGKYSVCYDKKGRRKKRFNYTAAHRDHIHFGLNWPGARKRTSFWAR